MSVVRLASVKRLEQIARILDVSVEEFLGSERGAADVQPGLHLSPRDGAAQHPADPATEQDLAEGSSNRS